jgi:hypothetical protein
VNEIHRRADHRAPSGERSWGEGGRAGPLANIGVGRRDLRLEGQVQRDERVGGPAAVKAGRLEGLRGLVAELRRFAVGGCSCCCGGRASLRRRTESTGSIERRPRGCASVSRVTAPSGPARRPRSRPRPTRAGRWTWCATNSPVGAASHPQRRRRRHARTQSGDRRHPALGLARGLRGGAGT